MDGSWLDSLKDISGTFKTVASDAAAIKVNWQAAINAGAPVQTPQQAALIGHQVAVGAAQGNAAGSVAAADQWSLGSLGFGTGPSALLLLAAALALFLVLKK